jgi:CubicO group peptidase (beta-lactamase class C family)
VAAVTVLALAGCGGNRSVGDRSAVDVTGVWSRANPSSEGIDSKLLRGIDRRARDEVPSLESLLVVRHGRIVFERDYHGEAANSHDVQSVTKSVVSLLVGIALHERAIESLNQTLSDFLPRWTTRSLDPRVRHITLRQLLEIRAGFALDVDSEGTPAFESAANWTQAILARSLANDPGQSFAYDGGASHLLSVVLTQATGMPADEYARKRLFRPLGIRDSRWTWDRETQGNADGASGLSLRARDMARIGQLVLQHGRWNGRQLVPSDYIGEATQTQESARFPAGGPLLGYGYQFWTLPPHGFAAIGFGGQSIAVFPAPDLVVVTRGAITDIEPNGLFELLRELAEAARRQ